MPELTNHPDFPELIAAYKAKFGALRFSPMLVPDDDAEAILTEMRRAIAGQRGAITDREIGILLPRDAQAGSPRPPVITSYYGGEEDTRELDAILARGGYELIDPPVCVYSSREEIEAWIDELRQREQNEQVRFAIEDAETMLKIKDDNAEK